METLRFETTDPLQISPKLLNPVLHEDEMDVPDIVKIEPLLLMINDEANKLNNPINEAHQTIKTEPIDEEENSKESSLLFKMLTTKERKVYQNRTFNPKIISDEVIRKLDFRKCYRRELNGFQCPFCSYYTKRKVKGDLKTHLLIHQDPDTVTKYKCTVCNFKTKYRDGLRQHLLLHQNPDKVNIFKCKLCYFKTKYKFCLKNHVKRHNRSKKSRVKNPSTQGKDLEVKESNILTEHCDKDMVKTEEALDISIIQEELIKLNDYSKDQNNQETEVKLETIIVKTELCDNDFDNPDITDRSNASVLTGHNSDSQIAEIKQENHKEDIINEEVPSAPYNNDASHLTFHNSDSSSHIDEQQNCRKRIRKNIESIKIISSERLITPDCNSCFKKDLNWYQCPVCPYHTKRKSDLTRHLATHQSLDIGQTDDNEQQNHKHIEIIKEIPPTLDLSDTSDVTFCKSDIRNQKKDIEKNIEISREGSITIDFNDCFNKELNAYQCPVCPYYTKRKMKSDLKTHLLSHYRRNGIKVNIDSLKLIISEEVSSRINFNDCFNKELNGYQCPVCPFYTKRKNKSDLRTHLLIHQDPDAVSKYKCTICHFKTKYRDCFKKHLATHQSSDASLSENENAQEQKLTPEESASLLTDMSGNNLVSHPKIDNDDSWLVNFDGFSQINKIEQQNHKKDIKEDNRIKIIRIKVPSAVDRSDASFVTFDNSDNFRQMGEIKQQNRRKRIRENIESIDIISGEGSITVVLNDCFKEELNGYQCPACPFYTKRKMKSDLKTHLLIHQDPDAACKYKCSFCKFKTKYRDGLRRHLDTHQSSDISQIDESELRNYRKDIKEYNSIEIMSREGPVTVDVGNCFKKEVNGYQCPVCPFYTKRKMKADLRAHLLVHQDPDAVSKYKCTVCNFKTKWRFSLRKHLITHQSSDISSSEDENAQKQEWGPEELDQMDEQQNRRKRFKKNMDNFNVISREGPITVDLNNCFKEELNGYQCPVCPYYTKRKMKSDLRTHLLTHQDPDAGSKYKCRFCNFQTKYRDGLRRHFSTHQSSDISLSENENTQEQKLDPEEPAILTTDMSGINFVSHPKIDNEESLVNFHGFSQINETEQQNPEKDIKENIDKIISKEVPTFHNSDIFRQIDEQQNHEIDIKENIDRIKILNEDVPSTVDRSDASVVTFDNSDIFSQIDEQQNHETDSDASGVNFHNSDIFRQIDEQQNHETDIQENIDRIKFKNEDVPGAVDRNDASFVTFDNSDIFSQIDEQQNRGTDIQESIDRIKIKNEDFSGAVGRSDASVVTFDNSDIFSQIDEQQNHGTDIQENIDRIKIKNEDVPGAVSDSFSQMGEIKQENRTKYIKENMESITIMSGEGSIIVDFDDCFKKELNGYQCPVCPYYTKRKKKAHLRTHLLIHQDPAAVSKYKCTFCNFKTKYLNSIKKHMTIHQTTSDISSSEDENTQKQECGPEESAILISDMSDMHVVSHPKNDNEEALVYIEINETEQQNYEKGIKEKIDKIISKEFSSNRRKRVRKKDSFKVIGRGGPITVDLSNCFKEELNVYQCPVCPYYTKRKMKSDLRTHLLTHQDPNVITKFKCRFCNFQTKYRDVLRRHLAAHPCSDMSSSENENSGPEESDILITDMSDNNIVLHTKILNEESLINFDGSCQINETEQQNHKKDIKENIGSTKIISNDLPSTVHKIDASSVSFHNSDSFGQIGKIKQQKRRKRVKENIESINIVSGEGSITLDFDDCFKKELNGYQCPVCPYYTKRKTKSDLRTHLLIHQDQETVSKYKCEFCNFKTKYKDSIKKHLVTHLSLDISSSEDEKRQEPELGPEEPAVLITDMSGMNVVSHPKTDNEESLDNFDGFSQINETEQQNREKDITENIDEIISKVLPRKRIKKLNSFKVISKEGPVRVNFNDCFKKELNGYQCPVCPYYTKRKMKSDLRTHLLTHQDPNAVSKFKCTSCNFKTKYRDSLKKHLATHQCPDISLSDNIQEQELDPEDPAVFITNTSDSLVNFHNFDGFSQVVDFDRQNQILTDVEKYVENLDFDLLFKKDLNGYQCPVCPYYTKRKMKGDLRTHLLVHQDPKTASKYECAHCPFKTKYKDGLKRHVTTHEKLCTG